MLTSARHTPICRFVLDTPNGRQYRVVMPLRLVAVSFDSHDPSGLAAFWAGMLGRKIVDDASAAALLPGDDTQVGLRFVAAASDQGGASRLHLHLTSSTSEDQERIVDAALRLGAHHLDVGQLPDDEHIVLADPGGNAFCVIEPGNKFLAGCGLLGEVACDGHRDVGLFWRDALGWPLVWDQDEETAVQSPVGGTKVSWGGPPVDPKTGRNWQRFELVASDLPAEVTRLVALGATRARRPRRRRRALRPRRQRVPRHGRLAQSVKSKQPVSADGCTGPRRRSVPSAPSADEARHREHQEHDPDRQDPEDSSHRETDTSDREQSRSGASSAEHSTEHREQSSDRRREPNRDEQLRHGQVNTRPPAQHSLPMGARVTYRRDGAAPPAPS